MNLPETMNCMMLPDKGKALEYREVPLPAPMDDQVLVKVLACGVCRTDLHIVDGELIAPKLPLIPGHEIIGTIVQTGLLVTNHKIGDLVGIPWLGYTCGTCKYCLKDHENLCENARFTGYTLDGGFSDYTVAYASYCFSLPSVFNDPSMAPLLCAGLIGYRSFRMAGPDAENIGLYGFGAAAHILIQVAIKLGKKIFAFTRPGDTGAHALATKLGAYWVGDSNQNPPELLDAAIIFAPAGELVPKALQDTDKGGTVICGGIYMSDIPSFPYDILWGERTIRSVANLTRKDATEFIEIAIDADIHTETRFFRLSEANEALKCLKTGKIKGACVLVMD